MSGPFDNLPFLIAVAIPLGVVTFALGWFVCRISKIERDRGYKFGERGPAISTDPTPPRPGLTWLFDKWVDPNTGEEYSPSLGRFVTADDYRAGMPNYPEALAREAKREAYRKLRDK